MSDVLATASPWLEIAVAGVIGLGIGIGLIVGAVTARELLRRTHDPHDHENP
jgi:short subunit fatty acids transporter